jgi:hypothetical protein
LVGPLDLPPIRSQIPITMFQIRKRKNVKKASDVRATSPATRVSQRNHPGSARLEPAVKTMRANPTSMGAGPKMIALVASEIM